MANKNGSVLAITIGFVLIFTMLGFASIYLTGLNRETSQKQIASNKAFWLAEAGIERAFAQLPGSTLNVTNISLGEGRYTVTTGLKAGFTQRWVITATATVPPVTKRIQCEVGAAIINAFQTTGTLKPGSETQIIGTYTVENPYPFNFEEIFGMSHANMQSIATQILTNPQPQDVDNVTDGLIWVNGDFKVSRTDWIHKGILIVNGNFEMTGGQFSGIVWVNGEAKMIEGNPGVNGAVFVNDPNTGQTKIDSSMATVSYDEQAIDAAFDMVPGGTTPGTFHHLIHWKELD